MKHLGQVELLVRTNNNHKPIRCLETWHPTRTLALQQVVLVGILLIHAFAESHSWQSGAFSQASNAANQSTSLFGAPKPATGFGAFGGGTTSTFGGGGGGVFGQNANTAPTATGTSLFGQPASTGAFGSTTTGTSLFNKPASTFGAATCESSIVDPRSITHVFCQSSHSIDRAFR
jgi:hypothetical protein